MEYSSPVPSSPAMSATMVSDPVALLATADFDMTTVTPADLASPTPDIKLEADEETPEGTDSVTDKKPTKKRKSWGQVLPEPKTNLPPRKRAKTDDEKEQRRVERVIRNRKAASASRERKRQEAEALALRNKELEAQLAMLQERNNQLERELKIVRPEFGASSPSNESVTFSQELFPSQQLSGLSDMSQSSLNLLNDLLNKSDQTPKTVDPMTISPALSPVPEDPEFDEAAAQDAQPQQVEAPKQSVQADQTTTSNHPSTQYPAAVLWHDLQCQRPVGVVPWYPSTSLQNHLTAILSIVSMVLSLSTTLTALSTPISSTPSSISRTATPTTSWLVPPLRTALISIIFLVTNPTSRRSSSTSTSAPTSQAMAQPTTLSNSNKKTLRLRTLRKLLTCNRQLARPLQDATLDVLRLSLTKESGVDKVIALEKLVGGSVAPALERQVADGFWPTKERLISLLWAIRALERRIDLREQGVQDVKRVSYKMAPRVRTGRPRGQPRDTI